MDDTIHEQSGIDPQPLADEVGIDVDDAGTVLNDVLPILKRKLELAAAKTGSSTIDVSRTKKLINAEVPKVLSNYALTHLKDNRKFLAFLVKRLFGLSDKQARKLIDKIKKQSPKALAEQLAAQLGIHPTEIQTFTKKIIPKIKSYSKSMLRKKLENERSIEDPEKYYQFIIDNVFIDEFENHPFIRSTTDASNQAILNPEALDTAYQLLRTWTREAAAESR